MKIESSLRQNNELSTFSQAEIVQKIKGLESQVELIDQNKRDLTDKLRITEDNN